MDHFQYSSTEVRSIKVPGRPSMTRRQSVNVRNGVGRKSVEHIVNGRVVARNEMPIAGDHVRMIANKEFVPGLFSECAANMRACRGSAGKSKTRKTARKSRK